MKTHHKFFFFNTIFSLALFTILCSLRIQTSFLRILRTKKRAYHSTSAPYKYPHVTVGANGSNFQRMYVIHSGVPPS